MKIVAGCISLLVAIVLLVGAFMDWQQDAEDAANQIKRGFAEINQGDYAAFQRDMAETEARKNSQAVRAVVGAAFLVVGFILFARRAKAKPEASIAEAAPPKPDDSRKCPFCAEIIKREAVVCRFCGRNLPAPAVDA